MKRLFGPLLAVLLITVSGATSAAYASGQMTKDEWEAVSYATALFAMQHAPPEMISESGPRLQTASWDVATPAMVGSYIAMVLDQPSTPCLNCVNGHELGTFGTGDPLGYVNSSLTLLKMLYVYFDVSYTHLCTISVALTQGTTVLKTASGNFTPTPGAVEYSSLKVTRAATWHGAALMTGKLVCGTLTVTNKGTVYFQ